MNPTNDQRDASKPTTQSLTRTGVEDDLIEGILLLALRNRRILLGLPLALLAVTVGILFMLPRKYTTVTSFAPTASAANLSQLSGLAAQFGLSFPVEDPTQSPLFYADLISTDQFLQRLVEARYDADATASGSLIDLYKIDGHPGEAMDDAIRLMRDELIAVSTDRQTGVVRVSIKTKWRRVSADIGRHLLQYLNDFNVYTRQRQAKAEALFVKERLDSAASDLRVAENALRDFSERNRSYQSDPSLVLQRDRLVREITLRQEVYTTFVQAYEQARVQAVRDTPAITVVEQPDLALRPDRRHLLARGFAALFGGLLLAAVIIALVEYNSRLVARGAVLHQELMAALPKLPWHIGSGGGRQESVQGRS